MENEITDDKHGDRYANKPQNHVFHALTPFYLSVGFMPTSGQRASRVSDQQIDNEHDQQKTTDAETAAISPTGITETAPKKEDQDENNEDQVHRFALRSRAFYWLSRAP